MTYIFLMIMTISGTTDPVYVAYQSEQSCFAARAASLAILRDGPPLTFKIDCVPVSLSK